MSIPSQEPAVRARADLVTSLVLIVLGVCFFYISYDMPRLEARRIHPSTIPGLVPMILSAGLVLCGALLAWKAIRTPSEGGWSGLFGLVKTMTVARVLAAMALVLIFALGLVGFLPFGWAAAVFVFAFIVTFELVLTETPVPLVRSLAWALFTAALCGGGVHYLFAEIFLVRLP